MQSKYAVAISLLSLTSSHAFLHTSSLPPQTMPHTKLYAIINNDTPNHDGDEDLFTTAVANGYTPPNGVQFAGIRRTGRAAGDRVSSTQLGMTDRNALIPDGGLSPCVIKVVGVGGGGCNAVSFVDCCVLSMLCVATELQQLHFE